jgi:zinc/manganese transport system substrate-binding protein
MKRLLACLALVLLFAAPARAEDKLPVVATFSILGDMVKTIGGDDIAVTTLVGPDADTHTYEPATADARAIAGAKVVFMNGLGFEGWMPRLLESTGFKGDVVTASDKITPRTMDEDGKTITDPHAWQSLANGQIYLCNIEAALVKALPEKADAIHARAKAYSQKIADMDKWVSEQFAGIPTSRRVLITSHDAFGYFGAAYGVTIEAPQGVSTEAEPDAAGVAALIDQIRKQHVKEVFIENMTNPRLMDRIAAETGATLGKPLFSDALSPPGGPAPTWLDMFRNNVPLMAGAMKE